MYIINGCYLWLFLTVVVSIPVKQVMFYYHEDWANYQTGWCEKVTTLSDSAVCQQINFKMPCQKNQFAYALRNGTGLTPYRLNLTLKSLTQDRQACTGQAICSCYFDQRNITGTLTFDSNHYTLITANLLTITSCIAAGIFIFVDYLTERPRP